MLLRMFGIGVTNAIAGGQTEGTVTEVKTCYWFKVNTKPVRTHAGDGAVYPHIIHFTYNVAGQTYIQCGWADLHRKAICAVEQTESS